MGFPLPLFRQSLPSLEFLVHMGVLNELLTLTFLRGITIRHCLNDMVMKVIFPHFQKVFNLFLSHVLASFINVSYIQHMREERNGLLGCSFYLSCIS